MTFNELKELNPKKTLIKACTYIGSNKKLWMKATTNSLKSAKIIGSTDEVLDCDYITNNDGSFFIRKDVVLLLKRNTINTDNVDQRWTYTVNNYIKQFESQFK